MTRPSWWAAIALVATGCIPAVTGAPCETDANCPDTQVCLAGKCAEGVRMGGGPGGGGAATGGGDAMGGGGGAVGGGAGGGGAETGGGGGTTGGGGGSTGGGGGSTGGGGGSTGGGGGTGGGSGAVLPQAYELISAGGRAQGGTLTLDLQVGHPTPRTKMTGGTLEVTGAAAVQR